MVSGRATGATSASSDVSSDAAAPWEGGPVRRVGVVSLGLIGGSVARRLVAAGVEVHAWNPSLPDTF